MISQAIDVADAVAAGRNWLGHMRRVAPTLAIGVWADGSMASGTPVGNYYASTPLVGATLSPRDGIDCGPNAATGTARYLKRVTMIPTSVSAGIQSVLLHDICLYYPFVDGDGGAQDMIAGAGPVTKYNGGKGCRIFAVSQGPGSGAVDVRVTYTNSAGVAGKQVTQTLNLAAALGSLCSSPPPSTTYASPCAPYLPWAAGDVGVQSIQNVEPLSGGGGIAAFVIAKPLTYLGAKTNQIVPVEVCLCSERALVLPEIGPDPYMSALFMGTAAAAPGIFLEVETIRG